MNVAAKRSAVDVLVEMRASEGSSTRVSMGAFALSELLADEDPAVERFTMFVGGARSVERMVAGTLLPCQSWGEEMGRLTDGKLTSAMFLKPWPGTLPAAAAVEAADAVLAPEARQESEALAVIRGRIGETPSGPLFSHFIDPTSPNGFVVTGLGMALHFDEPAGFAMRNALAAGLMDLATRRGAQVAAG